MVIWVKTTIDIADVLLRAAKRRAQQRETTLKVVVEDALREYLQPTKKRKTKYKWKDLSVGGEGLVAGVDPSNWNQIRSIIYEGRGG